MTLTGVLGPIYSLVVAVASGEASQSSDGGLNISSLRALRSGTLLGVCGVCGSEYFARLLGVE